MVRARSDYCSSTHSHTRLFVLRAEADAAEAAEPVQFTVPAYVTPIVTMDDCQALRSEIGSHIFDRLELAKLQLQLRALQ